MDVKTAKKKGYKVVKNRQRPDMCYSYEKETEHRKYVLFTMNGGTSFLVSIKERNVRGYFTEDVFSKDGLSSVAECEQAIKDFEKVGCYPIIVKESKCSKQFKVSKIYVSKGLN